MKGFLYFSIFLHMLISSCTDKVKEAPQRLVLAGPEELYGDLFFDVQGDRELFADSKTFVDCVPLVDATVIRENYSNWPDRSTNGLRIFVMQHFRLPAEPLVFASDSSEISEHIARLWQVLKRPADERTAGTLIPLPYAYVVPGGRFREVYYWDSYFTMLGLKSDGQTEAIENTVRNFSWLLDNLGFIPNGNRTYYLSRSQPPFFAPMVQLLAEEKGKNTLANYLPQLETEHAFWMFGADSLDNGHETWQRVVRMRDGELLNRYWDDKATPRPESFAEDIQTMREVNEKFPGRDPGDVFRHLRAAAESGWDFSSRWLRKDEDGKYQLNSIHTTDIVPVDLNCLLYYLENTISEAAAISGDQVKALDFKVRAVKRKEAILKYCWDEQFGFFMDYDLDDGRCTEVLSLAGVFPLYFKIADSAQAETVTKKLQISFLKPGGLVTTLYTTGEQWDGPNGWAPLQYMAVKGLQNYGQDNLAAEVRQRWLRLNQKIYSSDYRLTEKYNVQDTAKAGGGGEYPNQDGFGWTNGVYQAFATMEAELAKSPH